MNILSILAGDVQTIPYRKQLNKISGSVTATILLQQIIYYSDYFQGEFYRFKQPCKHHLYKHGESFVEVLGFSKHEFDTALRKLISSNIVEKRTTMDRMTFYKLNNDVLIELIEGLGTKSRNADLPKDTANSEAGIRSQEKQECGHTKSRNADLPLYTKTTKDKTKTKEVAIADCPLQEVFDFWLTQINDGKKYRFTPKKKQQIKARLKSFSVEEVKQAITNCCAKKYNRENNYMSIDLIFRSDDKLEGYLNSSPTVKATVESMTDSLNKRILSGGMFNQVEPTIVEGERL